MEKQHTKEKQRAESRNVTLYPQDWKDIEEVANNTGVNKVSAALRIIIQEWRLSRTIKPLEVVNVTAAN